MMRKWIFCSFLFGIGVLSVLANYTEQHSDGSAGQAHRRWPMELWNGLKYVRPAVTNTFQHVSAGWETPSAWSLGVLPTGEQMVVSTNGGPFDLTLDGATPFAHLNLVNYGGVGTKRITFTNDFVFSEDAPHALSLGTNTTVRFLDGRVTGTPAAYDSSYNALWIIGEYDNWFKVDAEYLYQGKNASVECSNTVFDVKATKATRFMVGHGGRFVFNNSTWNYPEYIQFYILDNGIFAATNSIFYGEHGGSEKWKILFMIGSRLFLHDCIVTNTSNGGACWSVSSGSINPFTHSKEVMPTRWVLSGTTSMFFKDQGPSGTTSFPTTTTTTRGYFHLTLQDQASMRCNHFGFRPVYGATNRLVVLDAASFQSSVGVFGSPQEKEGAERNEIVIDTTGTFTVGSWFAFNVATNENSSAEMTIRNGTVSLGAPVDGPGVLIAGNGGAQNVYSTDPADHYHTRAEATLNMEGGSLTTRGGLSEHMYNGFMLGRMDGYGGCRGISCPTEDPDDVIPQYAVGRLNLSGGVITNNLAIFAAGVGSHGTGIVHQTGGTFLHTAGIDKTPFVIGHSGGSGFYTLDGGALDVRGDLYVGGASVTNIFRVDQYPSYKRFVANIGEAAFYQAYTNSQGWFPIRENRAHGNLTVNGGIVSVTNTAKNARLILGRSGSGRLTVGPNAAIQADRLLAEVSGVETQRLHYATVHKGTNEWVALDAETIAAQEPNSTTILWRFGETDVGTVQVKRDAQFASGVICEIDATAYRGNQVSIPLLSFAQGGAWTDGGMPSADQFRFSSAAWSVRIDEAGITAEHQLGTVLFLK